MKFILNKKVMAEKIREHRPIYHRLNQLIFQAFEVMTTPTKTAREGIIPIVATEEYENQ